MIASTSDNAGLAVSILLRGYQEELNLYSAVREISLSQKEILGDGADLGRFCALLDEKDDILGLIGRIDTEMERARKLVASAGPAVCPDRRRLATLLDRVTDTIEDIRAIEQDTLSLLDGVRN